MNLPCRTENHFVTIILSTNPCVPNLKAATFVDTTAPLVAGQPEQREYRAQGMVNNVRTGDLSPTVSIVTMP